MDLLIMWDRNMELKSEYQTKDFYHAVVLKTVGKPLVRLEQGEGKFSYFVFDDSDSSAEATIRKYWSRELQVDPKSLIDSIIELKTRLYSGV